MTDLKTITADSKAPPYSLPRLLADIHALRPDLTEQSSSVPNEGQSSLAILIGNEVFKGSRGGDKETFLFEAEIMKALEGKELSARVPRITTLSREPLLFGMERMNGEKFSFPEKKDVFAKSVGLFMSELEKALPLSEGSEKWIEDKKFSDRDDAGKILNDTLVQDELGPYWSMCNDSVARAKEIEDNSKLILDHGDYQPSNIGLETTGEMKFILDFGRARYRPPAAALSDLMRSFGIDTVREIHAAYSGAQDRKTEWQDVVLWRVASQVLEIPQLMKSPNKDGLEKVIDELGTLYRELDKTKNADGLSPSAKLQL